MIATQFNFVIPGGDLPKVLRELNAPVYVKRLNHSNRIAFVRRRSCSVEDVLRFFDLYGISNRTNDERTTSER